MPALFDRKAVGTSGVKLFTNSTGTQVQIAVKASPHNTAFVGVGVNGTTAADAFPLGAADAIVVSLASGDDVYAISREGTQQVFIAVAKEVAVT